MWILYNSNIPGNISGLFQLRENIGRAYSKMARHARGMNKQRHILLKVGQIR